MQRALFELYFEGNATVGRYQDTNSLCALGKSTAGRQKYHLADRSPSSLACRIPLMTSTETWCRARTDRNRLKNPGKKAYLAVKSAHNTAQLTRSVVLFVPHFHRPSQIKSLMAFRSARETKQPLRRVPSQSCGSSGALSTPTYSNEDLKLGWMFYTRSASPKPLN